MPLVNEVVIPLGLKDAFNSIAPSVDLSLYGLLQELSLIHISEPTRPY